MLNSWLAYTSAYLYMHQVVRLGMLFTEKHYRTLYIRSFPSQNISMHTATIYLLQLSVANLSIYSDLLCKLHAHIDVTHTGVTRPASTLHRRAPSLGAGAEKPAKGGLLC